MSYVTPRYISRQCAEHCWSIHHNIKKHPLNTEVPRILYIYFFFAWNKRPENKHKPNKDLYWCLSWCIWLLMLDVRSTMYVDLTYGWGSTKGIGLKPVAREWAERKESITYCSPSRELNINEPKVSTRVRTLRSNDKPALGTTTRATRLETRPDC